MAVEATDAAGAELIEAHVARRRAELARLSLAARTARQRCDRAESELAGVADADADGAPADLLGVVDAMLEKAIAASELALASAEREASFIIDRAMADGSDVVRRAGLDPSVLRAEHPAGSPVREVAAPPSAAELWRATRPRVSPSTPGWVPPQASAPTPPAPGPVATLVRDEPAPVPAFEVWGETFDAFWQEVPGERRVRDRILRRSPKESA